MNLRFAALLSLAVIPLLASGQKSTVSGTVAGGQGRIIRLMKYSDQVSYLRTTLDSDTVNADGAFHMECEPAETIHAWLDIDFQQADLFIQPGEEYSVAIDSARLSLTSSYFDRGQLPMEITDDDSDRLNLYIREFNELYNDYLLNYTGTSGPGSPSASFEAFRKAVQIRFQNAENPYLQSYIRYKSASMQMFLRIKGRDKLGLEFISGQPVLYENVEYMDFFHLYFEKYFIAGSKYFSFNKTFDLVNGPNPAATILDSLKVDPVLTDLQTRELLLISGLTELVRIQGFKKERVRQLIGELASGAVSRENREIASNLLARLDRLQPGTQAPPLEGIDVVSGQRLTLSDFQGRKLYLAFFESRNPASQSELDLGGELIAKYGERVNFVAVSVDKDPQKLRDYIKASGTKWRVILHDGNPGSLEDYDATTFPHFVLIGPDGKIIRCPAPSPSENIRRMLDSF
jgi:hypothetical protein